MFTSAELPPVAIENRAEIRRKSFRQKQLALAQRKERRRAGGIRAFVKHRLVQSSRLWNFGQRDSEHRAREMPNTWRVGWRLLTLSDNGLDAGETIWIIVHRWF